MPIYRVLNILNIFDSLMSLTSALDQLNNTIYFAIQEHIIDSHQTLYKSIWSLWNQNKRYGIYRQL